MATNTEKPALDDQSRSEHTLRVLASVGLREHHRVLDIGCGSLRGGKLVIPFLLPGRYCGIEPNAWLVDAGIAQELGEDIRRVKQPRFAHNEDFDATSFGETFDLAIAQSIFSHAPKRMIQSGLERTKQVLADDGVFVFTYWPGDTDHHGNEWVYPGTTPFTDATITDLCAQAGMASATLPMPHPAGQIWKVTGAQHAVDRAMHHAASFR